VDQHKQQYPKVAAMCIPSSHFAFRLDLADFHGEAFHVIAPKGAHLSDLVRCVRPELGCLCDTEPFTAGIVLVCDGEELNLEDARTLGDVCRKNTELKLRLLEPDSSIVARGVRKKQDCTCRWRQTVENLGREFSINETTIQAQLSARDAEKNLQLDVSAAHAGFLLVSLLSGDTHKLQLSGDFTSVTLHSLLAQVEAEFDIPSGGAELIWNSRRLLQPELRCTLQEIGLCSGEQLTCVRNGDSRFLAFLARLEIDQIHVTSEGHGLGGSVDQRVRFHLADQGNLSTGLEFEAWQVEHEIDGYGSCEAQLLWLVASDSPTCLIQMDCDEDGNKYNVFHALSNKWDSVAEKLDLASGTEAMQALSCVGFQETVRQAVLGRGMKYLTSSPNIVHQVLNEPQPKFHDRLPSRQLFVCLPRHADS